MRKKSYVLSFQVGSHGIAMCNRSSAARHEISRALVSILGLQGCEFQSPAMRKGVPCVMCVKALTSWMQSMYSSRCVK